MALQYSPKIVTDSLVMCLDASNNKSYPTDLPVKNGLLVWLDAADDTTFSYSSGTEVSQWRDKSGNNFHANQSTTAQQPSRSTVVNSRKSVNFTSTNGDRLRVNSGMVFTNSVTAIVFIKPGTQNYAYANVLDQDHAMDGVNGWVIQRNNVSSAWLSWVANAAGDNYFNPNQISYTDNTPQIVTLRKGSSTITLYSNGTSSGDVAVADQQIRQANYFGLNLGSWRAGNEIHGSSRHYNGEICEVVVYNRALSLTEMKQVHTYLGQKWGISNTDRSIVDLAGNDDNGLFGNGTVANMPLYDYYNKGAFKFFASNKYIKLGISTVVNQFAGDFTVSLWAMATGENSNYGNLIGDYYTAGTQTTNEWQIMMHNSSAFLIVYRHGTGNIINPVSSGFSANTWINVVLTRVGTAVTLYANNNVIGTATNSSVFGSATGNVNIGIDGDSSSERFTGLISNVLIYRKGLSAAEVLQNYEAQKSKFANTIVQQGLVLNLDAGNPYSYAGAGTTFYDVSGAGNDFTIQGNVTWDAINGFSNFDGNSTGSGNKIYRNSFPQNLKTSQGGNGYTIMVVARSTVSGGWRKLIGNGDGENYIDLYQNSTGNTWHQDGSGETLYVDGVQVAQDTFVMYNAGFHCYAATNLNNGSVINPTYALTIGNEPNSSPNGTNAYPWIGNIAIVLMYNRVLTTTELLQNYNALKGKFGL